MRNGNSTSSFCFFGFPNVEILEPLLLLVCFCLGAPNEIGGVRCLRLKARELNGCTWCLEIGGWSLIGLLNPLDEPCPLPAFERPYSIRFAVLDLRSLSEFIEKTATAKPIESDWFYCRWRKSCAVRDMIFLSLILIINDYYIVRPLPYPLMHDSVYEHLWTVWRHTKHELLILRSWWLNDACPSHLPWIPTRHLWRWKSWFTIAEDLPWLPWRVLKFDQHTRRFGQWWQRTSTMTHSQTLCLFRSTSIKTF